MFKIQPIKAFHLLATAGQAFIFFVVLSVVFSGGSSEITWKDFDNPPQQKPQDKESTIPLPSDWFTLSFAATMSISAAILSSQILPKGAVEASFRLLDFLKSNDEFNIEEKIRQMTEEFEQNKKELRQKIEDKMQSDFEKQKENLQQKFEKEKEKVGRDKERILKESFEKERNALKRAMESQAEKEILEQETKLNKDFEREKNELRKTVTEEVQREKDQEFNSRQELNRLQAIPTLQERQLKNALARQKEAQELIDQASKDAKEDAKTIFQEQDLK